jgi:hypothetical protein
LPYKGAGAQVLSRWRPARAVRPAEERPGRGGALAVRDPLHHARRQGSTLPSRTRAVLSPRWSTSPAACGLGSVIWRMTAGNFARLATRASHMASAGAVFVMVITAPRFLTSGSALPGGRRTETLVPDVPHRRHDPPGPTRRPGALPPPTRRSRSSGKPGLAGYVISGLASASVPVTAAIANRARQSRRQHRQGRSSRLRLVVAGAVAGGNP